MCNRHELIAVLAVVALILSARVAFGFSSRDVPAAELPTSSASPGPTSSPALEGAPSATAAQSPPTGTGNAPTASPEAAAPLGGDLKDSSHQDTDEADLENNEAMGTSESQPSPESSPPPPAIDAGALAVGPELGDQPLDMEIDKASDPSLAASLRVTENARKRLVDGDTDDAMRELARAVSLDASNAFAYYFLGRAYFKKRNYSQALTFFRRAEIGFGQRPNWAGEALSYVGVCDELVGKPADAAEAYKQALADSPTNFRARVGYGRLAEIGGAAENLDSPPPGQDLAPPPPTAPDESGPAEQAPAPD